MDQDLIDLCIEFVEKHPLTEDGFNYQALQEEAGDIGFDNFFRKLYSLLAP